MESNATDHRPTALPVFKKRAEARGATIYDVAAAAGVNASTVSRALNTPQRVSATTRLKVHKAARELSYKTNLGASRLGPRRQSTVGVITSGGISDAAQARILYGIEQGASANACAVIVSDARRSVDQERAIGKRLAMVTDGVIFLEPSLPDEELLEFSRGHDTVLVNRNVPGVTNVGGTASSGLVAAVRYLSGLGHRSVTFLAGAAAGQDMADETRALKEQCDWAGIKLDGVTCDGTGTEAGRLAARVVKATSCTAVICADDLIAIGVMQELQAAGIQVPQEVSVMGWGDIEAAALTTPSLSTVRPANVVCGQLAIKSLMELWRRNPPTTARVPGPDLIIRGSSGVAPGAATHRSQ